MVGEAISSALITAAGSIMAALITTVTAGTRRGWGLVVATAGIAAALVFYLTFDATKWRLENELPKNVDEDHATKIYPNVGLAFVYPRKWQIEDYAFRFGGGQIELVSDFFPEKPTEESQKITVGIINIAKHHWADPESEFEHVAMTLKGCNHSDQTKVSIADGQTAERFTCTISKPDGTQIDVREYFYQLSKCTRLKIWSASRLSSPDPRRQAFDSELEKFVSSIRLDAKAHSGAFCYSDPAA